MNTKPPNYRTLRVLVLEDENYTRRIICGLLRQLGFHMIDEASDGGIGLTTFLAHKPDFVLCDVHMEPVDGMTFLIQVRSLDTPQAHTPIVFLTGDAAHETVVSAKALQADGYLVKPISLNALRQRVDVVISKLATA